MAELFKFRCPDCKKLLGVPPRKVGRPVNCPRCRAELIVPDPEATVEVDPDATVGEEETFDLGIDLGFASPLDVRPEGAAGPAPERPDPDAVQAIAFLETAAAQPDPNPTPAEPDDESDFEPEDDPEPIVSPAAEPLAARSGRPAPRAAVDRRRDVVLPRTAAIAWALFALLALALSFTAGLMIGHYRWK